MNSIETGSFHFRFYIGDVPKPVSQLFRHGLTENS